MAENGRSELAELRRSYHDRIADLRQRSLDIVAFSVSGVGVATGALLAGDITPVFDLRAGAGAIRSAVEAIDTEVVSLLALESPVARDLRLILAARDVAQIGQLCAGLCVALAGRAGGAGRVLLPGLTELVTEVSTATAGLLATAQRAWAVLDAGTAIGIVEPLEAARRAETQLVGSLLDLKDVPIDAALDLAMATRAFDRLTDHAEEIAEKVCFATGQLWPVARD